MDVVLGEPGGTLRFHPAPPPTDDEMDRVLATIERRVQRLLARRGVSDADGSGGENACSEREPVLKRPGGFAPPEPPAPSLAGAPSIPAPLRRARLWRASREAGLAAASVQGRVALGARAGAAVRRCGGSPDLAALSVSGARRDGFDLHAGVVVPARDRARLERLCRYALRPPVADDRVRLTDTGQILLELRHRWADGTTHLLFDPLELLERLAALTPRPRINLVLYDGVLAAHAAWRSRLPAPDAAVTAGPSGGDADPPRARATPDPATAARGGSNRARCGGRFRLIALIALIDNPRVVQRILAHLRLPCEVPGVLPPRAPPLPLDRAAAPVDDGVPAA